MNSVSFSVSVHAGRDDAGGDVAAHVRPHRRQDVHPGDRVGVEAQLVGDQLGRRGDRRDVRLLAQGARLQAEEQVCHRRVAGDGELVDLALLDAVALLELLEQVVDRLHGELLQPLQSVLALGVDDAADDVVAAGDLPVVGARGVGDAAGEEVDEVGDHGRGAEVDGDAHARLREGRRVHAQQARREVRAVHPVAHLERHGDLPVGVAQGRAEPLELWELGPDLRDVVLLLQRTAQAVEVAGLVLQRRRLDLELEEPDGRVLPVVADDRQRLRLGDGVAVRPHLLLLPLGHVDLDGAGAGVGLAGDRPALEDLVRGHAGVAAPLDLTARDAHAAAAATSLPRARGRDVQLAEDRRVEQAGALRHLDGLPGRREGDLRHRRPRPCGGSVAHAPQTFLM